jgi:hypothetical protein
MWLISRGHREVTISEDIQGKGEDRSENMMN